MLGFWVWSSYFSSTEWLLIPEKLSIYILHMCLFIVLKLCLFTWLVSISWVGHLPPTPQITSFQWAVLIWFYKLQSPWTSAVDLWCTYFCSPPRPSLVTGCGPPRQDPCSQRFAFSSGDRPKDTHWLKTTMLRMREALTEVWGLWEKWAIISCEKRGRTDEKHRISLNAVIWEVWTQGQGNL